MGGQAQATAHVWRSQEGWEHLPPVWTSGVELRSQTSEASTYLLSRLTNPIISLEREVLNKSCNLTSMSQLQITFPEIQVEAGHVLSLKVQRGEKVGRTTADLQRQPGALGTLPRLTSYNLLYALRMCHHHEVREDALI